MMEPYWNKLNLDKPPTVPWRCTVEDFDHDDFVSTVKNIKAELESQRALATEAAILSRLIYRMKSKFRSDKGLKNMEKMNRALLNYLKLSLEKDYKYLIENTNQEGTVLFLPTKQMLQYVLVRMQGFAKLMCRIENVAEEAGKCFEMRINVGHAWHMSLMAYSIISRVWLLSRHLTKKCCVWYKQMIKYHEKLKIVGVPWLPQNYSFPKDLKSWLQVSWINEEEKIPENIPLNTGMFHLISQHKDEEENLECLGLSEEEEDILISPRKTVTEVLLKKCVPKISDEGNSTIKKMDEVGKKIRRDDFAMNLQNETTSPSPKKHKKSEGDFAMNLQNDSTSPSPKKHKKFEGEDSIEIPSKKMKIELKKNKKENSIDINKMKTLDDIEKLLNLDSYPGLDKLRWKMMRNQITKIVVKIKKNENDLDLKKKKLVMKKLIKSIREWIS